MLRSLPTQRSSVPVNLDRDAQYFAPPKSAEPTRSPVWNGGAGIDRDAQYYAPAQAAPRQYMSDPITEQFASGLAPIRFQYKPGMGPDGEQTGIRAQAAASQPVTASMIQQRPDGLLQIDPAMGLGTALAAAGHASRKQLALEARQNQQERRLDGLLAMAAQREGYR